MKTRLKPMGIGTILDNTFSILRERFWTFQAVNFFSLLPAVIILVLGVLVILISTLKSGVSFNLNAPLGELGSNLTLFFVFYFCFLVAMMIGSIFMAYGNIKLFKCGLHQEKCTYKEAFQGVRGKIWRYIGASLLVVCLTLPLMILYIIIVLRNPLSAGANIIFLDFIIVFFFILYPVVVFLEDKGVIGSLARSYSIMKKHRWRVFGIMLTVYVLAYVLLLILMCLLIVPLALVFKFFNVVTLILAIVFVIAVFLVFSIFMSYLYGPLTAIYYDLLIRKEGYDLKMQLSEENPVADINQPTQGMDT